MENPKKEMPKKELILTIGDNSYTVKFPDTGTLIDLEQAKARLFSPKNQTNSALWAYNLAIAIETFRILIPDLQKDMNVKSFDRLELMESQALVKAYINHFRPWFEDWMDIISNIFNEAENA